MNSVILIAVAIITLTSFRLYLPNILPRWQAASVDANALDWLHSCLAGFAFSSIQRWMEMFEMLYSRGLTVTKLNIKSSYISVNIISLINLRSRIQLLYSTFSLCYQNNSYFYINTRFLFCASLRRDTMLMHFLFPLLLFESRSAKLKTFFFTPLFVDNASVPGALPPPVDDCENISRNGDSSTCMHSMYNHFQLHVHGTSKMRTHA